MQKVTLINLIKHKSRNEPITLNVDINMTVMDLKKQILRDAHIKMNYNRIGLSYTPNENSDKITLSDDSECLLYLKNFNQASILYIKDLGPQISYRFVYIVEYLGPLIIFFLYFFNAFHRLTKTQQFCMFMSTFHYLKRIIESIVIHKFSKDTMPLLNLFKNCAYYWGYYGIICGYCLFREGYNEPNWIPVLRYFFVFLFFSAEIKNLKCHIILMELKIGNNGRKGIPKGEGFELVSCANYFWEILSWFCFSIFSSQVVFMVFMIIGFVQMKNWAYKKHLDYHKKFGDRYPKDRKMIIPYFL